jgi:hypothetical protein
MLPYTFQSDMCTAGENYFEKAVTEAATETVTRLTTKTVANPITGTTISW